MNLSNELHDALTQSECVTKVRDIASEFYDTIRRESITCAKHGMDRYQAVLHSEKLDELSHLHYDIRMHYRRLIRQAMFDLLIPPAYRDSDTFRCCEFAISFPKKARCRAVVNLVWNTKQAMRSAQASNIAIKCPVCMESRPAMALVPCGHLYCSSCADQLLTKSCAMCRMHVDSIHAIYQS